MQNYINKNIYKISAENFFYKLTNPYSNFFRFTKSQRLSHHTTIQTINACCNPIQTLSYKKQSIPKNSNFLPKIQSRDFFLTRSLNMAESKYDQFKFVTVTVYPEKAVAMIRFNRPDKMNALSSELVEDFTNAAMVADNDDIVRAMVVAGTEKFFVAGADIAQMNSSGDPNFVQESMFKKFNRIEKIKKPIIAAVNGYALGGGCEVAMMCDIVVAGEKAKFGQPEITLAIIPGIGGTQRLVRAAGKSKAMELILTGRFFTATEAYEMGVVSKVCPADKTEEEAMAMAEKIASFSAPAIAAAKAAVNYAYESTLQEGLKYEETKFNEAFVTEDREAGMTAFVQKQKAVWKHK